MSTVQVENEKICGPAVPNSGPDWFQKYAGPAADALLAFCKTHDIVNELQDAVALAQKCFQPSSIRLEEDVDPETDDRKVVIAVTTHSKSRQDVLAAYRDFRQQARKENPRQH